LEGGPCEALEEAETVAVSHFLRFMGAYTNRIHRCFFDSAVKLTALEKPVRLHKSHRLYLAAGGLLAVWSLCYFVNGYRVNWNFDRVPNGASKAEVVRLLGTPWKVDKCGELFSGGSPNPACAEEYLYKTPFAPWVPNYYSISFDSSGRVMEKYFYSSP
jgi:hypothetical protein